MARAKVLSPLSIGTEDLLAPSEAKCVDAALAATIGALTSRGAVAKIPSRDRRVQRLRAAIAEFALAALPAKP